GKGIRSQDPRILTELVTSKEGKNEYPNLNLYIKYNKLYDRIDQNRIFSEISELEGEVKLRLCEREEEKELVKLSRMLGVLQDLILYLNYIMLIQKLSDYLIGIFRLTSF
ncbi:unnamed protein product, partial [marine sediment metagenome]